MDKNSIFPEFRDVVGPGLKYQEIKPIGSGSFSVVWQMKDTATGQIVVGKFMDPSKMTEKNRNFALNEAHNASKITHPNVIQFIERIDRGDKLLLVFEYADAGDLYAQVNARAPHRHFKEAEIMLIFTQLCLALNQLHRRKMLHRDIKTPNVFLTTTGLIKLGDFGFSREYDSTVSGDVGSTFCGTPYYLAPELWNQAPYSKKADMWSLGIVLYELMALRKPFSGSSMRDLVSNVMTGQFDPLPEIYTPELRQLCVDLLSADPKRRPSIDQVFNRDVLRVHGLQVLQRNVPRLTSVPEPTRAAMVSDVEAVLMQSAAPDED